MPELDNTHTASTDPRKEELASLSRQWEAAGASEAGGARRDTGIWLRAGATLVSIAVAALVMGLTARSMAFWAEPGNPHDLGDLRDTGADPAEALARAGDNSHVTVSGLVPTRLVAVQDERAPAEGEAGYLFFCPLGNIVVFTRQVVEVTRELADHADPRLAHLVANKLALPEETAVSVAARGRLMRADAAPDELRPFVQSFAQRVQRAPDELWVLIDGARPADATWAALVWALAGAAPLLSAIFLVRALRLERRRRKGAES